MAYKFRTPPPYNSYRYTHEAPRANTRRITVKAASSIEDLLEALTIRAEGQREYPSVLEASALRFPAGEP